MPDESREAVFTSWLGQHGATVLKVARAYTRTAEDCQDLAQEILLQVWRSAPQFEGGASASTLNEWFVYNEPNDFPGAIVMTLPDFLAQDKFGYLHVSAHRIGLVDIVFFYQQGDSPEMLHARFPTLGLPLIHKVIAYYLENQADIDAYCARHAEEMARQRASARSGPSLEELQQRRDAARLAQGA